MATPGIRDPHRRLAARFFYIPEDEVTIEQRREVKAIVFDVLTKAEEKTPPFFVDAFMRRMEDHTRFTVGEINEMAGLLEMLHYGIDKNHGWLSEMGPHMPLGIYDHYKGGVYMADRVLQWEEDGAPIVSYLSMTIGRWFGRRCAEWAEVVQWPDGKYRSRYVYRGPDLRTPEPSFKVATPSDSTVTVAPYSTGPSMFPK